PRQHGAGPVGDVQNREGVSGAALELCHMNERYRLLFARWGLPIPPQVVEPIGNGRPANESPTTPSGELLPSTPPTTDPTPSSRKTRWPLLSPDELISAPPAAWLLRDY